MSDMPAPDLAALEAAVTAAEQAHAEANQALDQAQEACDASELAKRRADDVWLQRLDELVQAKFALKAALAAQP